MYKCVATTEAGEQEKTGTMLECVEWADDLSISEGTIKITLERIDEDGRGKVCDLSVF